MSRSFNGVDQRAISSLVGNAARNMAAPYTVHAKIRATGAGTNLFGLDLNITAVTDSEIGLAVNLSADDFNFRRSDNGVTNTVNLLGGDPTQNVWHTVVGRCNGVSDVNLFADDIANQFNNTTNVSVPAQDRELIIGALWNTGAFIHGQGDVAEVAVWNVALTLDEINSLLKGFRPRRVRPQSLICYVPLLRDVMEMRTNAPFTTTTGAAAAHPAVI